MDDGLQVVDQEGCNRAVATLVLAATVFVIIFMAIIGGIYLGIESEWIPL